MCYTTHMNTQCTPVSRALISVSDKSGIVALAKALEEMGIEIISTGGTGKVLGEAHIRYIPIEQYTHVPEMMDGRVKTMHPLITGGILGLRDRHEADAAKHGIKWIDLVVCNLYPFSRTVRQEGSTLDEAVEQIDIGGPTMVRSAAKNFGWTTIVTESGDYDAVITQLREHGTIPYQMRRSLAAKAFAHTATYDAMIGRYLDERQFPDELALGFTLHADTRVHGADEDRYLRYGENPHQKAAVYRGTTIPGKSDTFSLLDCKVLHGKQLSFNNLGDTYGAIDTLREFDGTACVVVKHASPCGVAVASSAQEALRKAFEADALSAFGGIVTLNRPCDASMATYLADKFIEVLAAVSFTEEALAILSKKKNLRILETGVLPPLTDSMVGRFIGNDLLLQQKDHAMPTRQTLRTVTKREPDPREIDDLLFAWKVAKHVKSNAIVTASDGASRGIGGGQVSRVDATRIAIAKSGTGSPIVLASDAFFPFRDSIDSLRDSGVRAIIQPGGSIRDQEVIDACDEQGIAMVFTGLRSFLHG